MTTFYSYTAQFDSLFFSSKAAASAIQSSSNNNNSSSSSSALQDYQTVSQVDLFHFSDPDHFKDVERQRERRAEALQRRRDRATENYISKKIKHGAVTVEEQLRIRHKLEQRRKNHYRDDDDHSSNSGSATASENENEVYDEKSAKTKSQTTRVSKKEKKTYRDSSLSSSSSESDRKNKGGKKYSSRTDRSNKRADRHRRPEDEVFSESDISSENGDDDSEYESSGHQSLVSGDEGSGERIRFRRNLNFKTDDMGALAGRTQLDAQEWKQVFEQKLDEQDLIREKQQQQQQKKRGKKTSRP
ncbi:hypothetical protein EDD21DRAFT_377084 [Dissophora ornata]|nr:hypothetical protein BGZ58_008205 [Dissophora ornata]KAI8600471.1 hypothetical protein EDD21DRAFT_377084 [Dissophora ornata]